MSVFMGDFLGFQLGNEHSYGLNITRVTTSDRYTDILLPSFTDQTADVPGGDGTYYWDTHYTSKIITIDFAFDDLRDEDLRKLRQMFAKRTVQPLILDEFPYKKYMVKCSASPTIKYIPFDQMEFRIYKGEGSISFIAYYPFAFSVVSPSIEYNTNGGEINNVGDMPANVAITYLISDTSNITLSLEQPLGTQVGSLVLSNISQIGSNDVYFCIDTRTQLVEGLDENYNKTGNLYNKFITSGDFFFPDVGRSYLKSTVEFEKAEFTPLYY